MPAYYVDQETRPPTDAELELELNHRVCSCALYFQNVSRLVAETIIIIIIITITVRPRMQQLHYPESTYNEEEEVVEMLVANGIGVNVFLYFLRSV